MTSTQRQPLPPCCHAVHPGHKDTVKVRFKTELSKVAVATKQEGFVRLANALTDARSALHLDRSATSSSSNDKLTPSVFASVDDIDTYIGNMKTYLSLVKGFTVSVEPPSQSPTTAIAVVDGALTPTSALRQPLMDDEHSPRDAAIADGGTTTPAGNSTSLSAHMRFCVWKDALSGTQLHAPSAHVETAQVLLASGLLMLNDARCKVDALLSNRLSELDEMQLKLAYQLFLTAAGVFDACLAAIGVESQAVGAPLTDLSISTSASTTTATADIDDDGTNSSNNNAPDADAMAAWRAEQEQQAHARAAAASTTTSPAVPTLLETSRTRASDFALLDRIPDLAHSGAFPQLLSWIALAEAQELVVLRGTSRAFVDFALLAKLAMDLVHRYRASHARALQLTASTSSSAAASNTSLVAERLRLFTVFKASYYRGISSYFQGAAHMAMDDATSCVHAIATFTTAKRLLAHAELERERYESLITRQREDRERIATFRAIYVRSPQIVDRDLEIMTHRNDHVYYEPIPEPDAPCDALSLVRATAFPQVNVHELWRDATVVGCLQPVGGGDSVTTGGASAANATRLGGGAAAATPALPKKSCCESCVIS